MVIAPENQFALLKGGLVGKIFDDLEVAVCATNSNHCFIYANRAFGAIYGYQAEDLIGLPAAICRSHEQKPDDAKTSISRVYQKRLIESGTYLGRKKSGEIVPVRYTLFPLAHFKEIDPAGLFAFVWPEDEPAVPIENVLMQILCVTIACPTLHPAATTNSDYPLGRRRRAREITRLVSLGYSNKEIAALMGISHSTVNVVRWKLAREARKEAMKKKVKTKGDRPSESSR